MRSELRKKALGSRPVVKEIVEVDGTKYEVRKPTYAARSTIFAGAKLTSGDAEKIDLGRFQALAIVHCVHDPETGEKVFEAADVDAILELPAGSLDALSDCAIKLLNVDKAAIEGKSEATPSDSSPSP